MTLTRSLCRVALPVAIVDLLNNTNVTYGEVLVYYVNVSAMSSGDVDCTTVTLRFTEFTSKQYVIGACVIATMWFICGV